jgi:hypothetical protein
MSDKKRLLYLFLWSLLLILAVGGCAGGDREPDLIGSYPSTTGDHEWYPPLPEPAVIVYHTVLDMRVRSVSRAFEEIKSLAHEHGGYVTTAQIWYEDRDEHATIAVSVPVFNFDLLYDRIVRLGSLDNETISGELRSHAPYERDEMIMSTITVHLEERSSISFPRTSDWHAASTFLQAFDVASTIFRFLLDAAIWVIVVAGPFVVLGWAVRRYILRRARQSTEESEENKS